MSAAAPIAAMLWENWRLTRVEAGQRLGLVLALGAGALLWFDNGPVVAFAILMVVHSYIWLSIAKLNGGRLADGYKPGFPFYLQFQRPVSTSMFVGVALVYDVVTCVALYVVSAALLGFVFDKPIPVFSVTLFLVAYHLAYACAQWATRSRLVQWVGAIGFSLPMYFMLQNRVTFPLRVEFTPVENIVFVLIGGVSVALTIAGVAKQRRGDSVAIVREQKEWSGGFPSWLSALFRLRCPTSSATKAQVWFELRSSGLPVLVVGFGLAMAVFLLLAVGNFVFGFSIAAVPGAILASFFALFGLGGNAFGIRRKQGSTYAGSFEMTQPYGTAQLACIKVAVRAACVIVSLLAIGAGFWTANVLVSEWAQSFINNTQGLSEVLLKIREKFAGDFGEPTIFSFTAFAVAASVAVASVVAWQAAREALRARYPRLLLIVQWLPTAWGLVSLLLALANRKGHLPLSVVQDYFTVTFWIAGIAVVMATTYLLWTGLQQRTLTMRHVSGAAAVAAVFATAWMVVRPETTLLGLLLPVLWILMLGFLAPWSLSRVRHV